MAEVTIESEKDSKTESDKNSQIVVEDFDKVYDMIEGKGRYKYMVLWACTIAYLSHMFYLFTVPYFLIRPTAMCDIEGYWHECTQEEVCESKPAPSYYLLQPVEFNFVTEFNWYCQEATSSFFTATAFFLGTTFSVLIVSNLSDVFGRIPLMVAGVLGNMLGVTLLMYFANEYVCFISSFIIGFFTMACNSCPFNFIADSVPEKYRDIYPSIMNIMWAVGEILIALIMWAGVQWRGMCLFIFLFSASFFIPLFWLRESPKFYFSQNKLFKAYARLQKIIEVNGVELKQEIKLSFPKGTSDTSGFGKKLAAMCCDHSMALRILLITAMLTIGNMIFYAMSLNLENMGGNAYVNGIMLAVAEIVACTCSGFSLKIVSPQLALSFSFSMTVVGLLGLAMFWDDPLYSIVFCVIGKLGSTSIDNLLYTLSGLFFPTAILGGALGIALFGTRLGNISAKPMYLLGAKKMCLIMAFFGVIAAILPWLLRKGDSAKKGSETEPKTEDEKEEKSEKTAEKSAEKEDVEEKMLSK